MYKELAKQQTNINEMLVFNYCLFGKLFSPFPSAARSDSVRRPIRFRSPSDQIPFGWRWLFVRFYCENIKDYCCLFYRIAIVFNPNRSLEIFSCKKSDYSRRCHRYSICILTQYVSFVQFQDKMKAKFSNDRFGFNVQTVVFVVMRSTDLVHRNEQRINRINRILYSMKKIRSIRLIRCSV